MDILIGAHEAGLAAAYATVKDLQAANDALRRQLQERQAALQDLRADNERLRTENADLRRRLQACDNVSRLITEAARRREARDEFDEPRRAATGDVGAAGNQPPGASLTVDAVISAFVEQLVALRDSFERDVARVARLQAVLEVELAAANRELNDLRAALDDRERQRSQQQHHDIAEAERQRPRLIRPRRHTKG